MCQCGCNDLQVDRAWRMPDGNVLVFMLYPGCAECFRGIGVNLYLFDQEGQKSWLDGVDIVELPKADEFGGDNGNGIAIPIIDIEKILKQARQVHYIDDDISEYETTADFLDDKLHHYLKANSVEVVEEWRAQQQSKGQEDAN